jgi:hypothetical protein
MPALGAGMTAICSARAHLRQATERLSHAHIKQFGSDEQMFGAEQQAQDEEQSD